MMSVVGRGPTSHDQCALINIISSGDISGVRVMLVIMMDHHEMVSAIVIDERCTYLQLRNKELESHISSLDLDAP